LTKKLYQVINIWIQNVGFIKATYSNLINILSICKLNAIKEDLLVDMKETSDHSVIDEIFE